MDPIYDSLARIFGWSNGPSTDAPPPGLTGPIGVTTGAVQYVQTSYASAMPNIVTTLKAGTLTEGSVVTIVALTVNPPTTIEGIGLGLFAAVAAGGGVAKGGSALYSISNGDYQSANNTLALPGTAPTQLLFNGLANVSGNQNLSNIGDATAAGVDILDSFHSVIEAPSISNSLTAMAQAGSAGYDLGTAMSAYTQNSGSSGHSTWMDGGVMGQGEWAAGPDGVSRYYPPGTGPSDPSPNPDNWQPKHGTSYDTNSTDNNDSGGGGGEQQGADPSSGMTGAAATALQRVRSNNKL